MHFALKVSWPATFAASSGDNLLTSRGGKAVGDCVLLGVIAVCVLGAGVAIVGDVLFEELPIFEDGVSDFTGAIFFAQPQINTDKLTTVNTFFIPVVF